MQEALCIFYCKTSHRIFVKISVLFPLNDDDSEVKAKVKFMYIERIHYTVC